MWSQSWASRGQRLSFLVCNLLWPCPIIETSDRVNGVLGLVTEAASRLAPREWHQEFDPIPRRQKPLQK